MREGSLGKQLEFCIFGKIKFLIIKLGASVPGLQVGPLRHHKGGRSHIFDICLGNK